MSHYVAGVATDSHMQATQDAPTTTTPVGARVERMLRMSVVDTYARRCADQCEAGGLLVDIGCGTRSQARRLWPHLRLIGVDSDPDVIATAEAAGTHDEFLVADGAGTQDLIRDIVGGRDVQCVCMFHVIEHLPKREGFELLDFAEELSDRFVFLETPNRFLPQGPEYGSEAQRHLSGWFWQDFVGRGYEVRGTGGTRWLRGYAGEPRLSFKGVYSVDAVLSRLLWIERNLNQAFNLTAWKDVRGVPARLG